MDTTRIRKVCQHTTSALLLTILITTTVMPTSHGDTYPSPDNNPSRVATKMSIVQEPVEMKQEEPVKTTPVVTEPPMTEPPVETIPETEPTEPYILYYTENDVLALARTLYNECGGVPSTTEQACVAWTACNRVDNGYWGDTILEVLTYPNAFAHSWSAPVTDELYDLSLDVLTRWNDEKNGLTSVGRVLPPDYTYFHGDGDHNYFRNAFDGNYNIWDYSLPSPYEN